jgi:hypothetical protein
MTSSTNHDSAAPDETAEAVPDGIRVYGLSGAGPANVTAVGDRVVHLSVTTAGMYLAQRAARAAKRAELEAQFSGNPVAALNLYRDWLPVSEARDDMRQWPVDEPESVVRNHGLDADG